MAKDNHITLVIDPLQGNIASVLSLQMAKVMANVGITALLMDTDLAGNSLPQYMGITKQKHKNILSLSDVLSGSITLNQAIFRYEKVDVILGNPLGKSITNMSESHFSIVKDDFLLMVAGYNKSLVKVGAFPDMRGGLVFADGAGQAVITTSPNPFAITKAYEIMALLPKNIKLWLAVAGEQSENESAHVFITLMRALKEMLKRELYFAGSINTTREGDIKKVALKLGLI